MNEETMDMKIDSGSMIRMKSSPRMNSFRRMVSPPAKAVGSRNMGRSVGARAPRTTAQADRAGLGNKARERDRLKSQRWGQKP